MEQISLISYGRDECKADKRRVYTIPDFYMIHFVESGCGYYNGVKLSAGQGFICMQNEVCNYIPDEKGSAFYFDSIFVHSCLGF